ncbi:MAG: SemiSWEET family transporter [Patescibacteria group bacterium]
MELVGYIAGFFSAVSLLPQIRKTLITRNVKGLSLGMILAYLMAVIFWSWYGILKSSPPIILTQILFGASTIFLLILRLKYKRND